MTVKEAQTIFLIEDSDLDRRMLTHTFRTAGLNVDAFASAEGFLETFCPGRSGCVVLDLELPGMSGEALMTELRSRGSSLPMVFVSATDCVSTAVRIMRQGAAHVLSKPLKLDEVLEEVRRVLDQHGIDSRQAEARSVVLSRFETLSPREREVALRIVSGDANKQIAYRLGISPRTVEVHRARVLQKMHASSTAGLVAMFHQIGKQGEAQAA